MVTGLLDATRVGVTDTSDFESVDLAGLLKDVSASMNLKAVRLEKKIVLSLPEDEQTLRVWGSQEQLIQLFINLLDNAIKHGQGSEISLLSRRLGEHVEVSIENDLAKSLTEEELARLFIPFTASGKRARSPAPLASGWPSAAKSQRAMAAASRRCCRARGVSASGFCCWAPGENTSRRNCHEKRKNCMPVIGAHHMRAAARRLQRP